MSWYAIEEIDNAVERTKGFLLPFNWKKWAQIAVIAFFAGAASFNMPTGFGDISTDNDETVQDYDGSFDDIGPTLGVSQAFIVFVAVLFAGLVAFFGIISKVFQFIYYQSLLDDNIKIVSDFKKHLYNGAKLFLFELAGIIAFAVPIILLIALIFVEPVLAVFTVLLGIPLFLVGVVFLQFTNEFIPLLVIEREQGILTSWSQMLDYIKDEWSQLGLYVIVRFFLGIAVQIIFGVMALMTLLIFAIPLGIVAVIFYLLMPILGLIAGIMGLIVWVLALFYFVNVPLGTFFKYYSILVYDDFTQVEEKKRGGGER